MNRRILFLAAPALLGLPLLWSCNRTPPAAPKPTPKPTPLKVSDADIAKHKPNEAGAVMVIMYHRFVDGERDNDLNRRPESFRRDLEVLREKGYYPVNALDLVENTMEVPVGKTPVVLTFDDALPSQLKIVTGSDGKAHIDPNCAAGIMETFSRKHEDWPTRGTFFVLPGGGRNPEPFGQSDSAARKLKYLSSKGYEIANHTTTHANMRRMDSAKVQEELAGAFKTIKQIEPRAQMRTLALPYGKLPRSEEARKYLRAGQSGGQEYAHKAVFLAAWRPVMSPVTLNSEKITRQGSLSAFDPYRLERVTPDARNAKTAGTLEYWIAWFDKNRDARYVSDGVDEIVTVPSALKSTVDQARIGASGKKLQVYGEGGADESGSGGGDLSVQ